MSPRIFLGGSLKGSVWTAHITDDERAAVFEGYRLPASTIQQLVDAGAETLVFVDPNRGRYVSEIDDWYEFGVWEDNDGIVALRQSWMSRG